MRAPLGNRAEAVSLDFTPTVRPSVPVAVSPTRTVSGLPAATATAMSAAKAAPTSARVIRASPTRETVFRYGRESMVHLA